MPVCITGMHRSGTSMVSRLLHRCGLYLGPEQHLMPATPDNADGYMENTGFVAINDEILIKLGGSWGNPPMLPVDWVEEEAAQCIRAKSQALLQEFQGREPWGWKDPRNSLTLPFWMSICPGVKVVICLRHPHEVARSLLRGQFFTDYSLNMTLWNMYPRLAITFPSYQRRLLAPPLGLKALKGINQLQIRLSARSRNFYANLLCLTLWKIYNQRILEASTLAQRIITDYEAYFRDPRAELRRVLEFLDLPFTDELLEQSCSIISATMRHNRFDARDAEDVDIPSEVSALYEQMRAEAGSP